MPPKKKGTASSTKSAATGSPSGATAAPLRSATPQPRPAHSIVEKILPLLQAVPDSRAMPSAVSATTHHQFEQDGSTTPSAEVHGGALLDLSTVHELAPKFLHAMFVVTMTEKAQLKLRSFGRGSSMPNVQPITPPGPLRVMTRPQHAAAAAAVMHEEDPVGEEGSVSSTQLMRDTTSPSPRKRIVLDSGPPLSPPPAPAPPLGALGTLSAPHTPQQQGFFIRRRSADPIHIVPPTDVHTIVFTEPRWLAAVSSLVHRTFTIEHVAQLARLFPTYFHVEWQQAIVQRSQGLERLESSSLRALFESSPWSGGGGGGATPNSLIATERFYTAAKGKVRLLSNEIPDIPQVQSAVAAMDAAILERALATSAQEQLFEQKRSAAQGAKRLRDSDEAAESSMTMDQEEGKGRMQRLLVEARAAAAAQLPSVLRDSLSAAKTQQYLESKAQEMVATSLDVAQTIERCEEMEHIVALYELLRSSFGPRRTTLGGPKLIELLVSQNRFHDSREDVEQQLRRLLEIPESGLTVVQDTTFCGSSFVAADDNGNDQATKAAVDLHSCVFQLSSASSKAALNEAVSKVLEAERAKLR